MRFKSSHIVLFENTKDLYNVKSKLCLFDLIRKISKDFYPCSLVLSGKGFLVVIYLIKLNEAKTN